MQVTSRQTKTALEKNGSLKITINRRNKITLLMLRTIIIFPVFMNCRRALADG